jgi:hypothetical protein
MTTKQDLMDEICTHLGIRSFPISTGSTEPKEFLLAVVEQLGLVNISQGLDKSEIGKLIVEADGELWLPDFDSTGGTITKEGLEAIKRAVFHLTSS